MNEQVMNYLSEEVSTCLCDEVVFTRVYDEEMLFQFKLANFDCLIMNVLFTEKFNSQKTFSLTIDNYCLSNIRYYVLCIIAQSKFN